LSSSPLSALLHPLSFPLSPSLQPSAPSTLHPSTFPVPSSLLPPLLSTSRFEPWLDTSIVRHQIPTLSRHCPDTSTLRHQCQPTPHADTRSDTPTPVSSHLDSGPPRPVSMVSRQNRHSDTRHPRQVPRHPSTLQHPYPTHSKDVQEQKTLKQKTLSQSKRRSGQKRSGQETLRAKDAQDKSNAPSSTRASTRASKRESMGHQSKTVTL